MPIPFKCEHCQAAFEVPDQHAGKRAKCPKCGQPIQVPMAPDTGTSSMKLRVARPLDAAATPQRPSAAPSPPPTEAEADEPTGLPGFQINFDAPAVTKASPAEKKTEKPKAPSKPEASDKGPFVRRKKSNKLPVFVAGGLGVVVVLIGAIAWFSGAFSSEPPAKPTAQVAKVAPKPQPNPPAASPITKPDPPGPRVEVPPPRPMPRGFSAWTQDFEGAKRSAKQRGTQVLLAFVGSDWDHNTHRLVQNVFEAPKFLQPARQAYELVVIDVPRTREGHSLLENQDQNEQLLSEFGVTRVPTVALTDADGLPYAVVRPEAEKATADVFLQWLENLGQQRAERDTLLAATREGGETQRLAACVKAVEWLSEREFTGVYAETIKEWLALARRVDASNAAGQQEILFRAVWLNRLSSISLRSRNQVNEAMQELLDFSEKPKFRDADLAVNLLLTGVKLMVEARNEDWVVKLATAAQQHTPKDPDLAKSIKTLSAMLKNRDQLGSGTGFVIARNGYILTNHHVIDGPGRVAVRLSDKEDSVPATVVEKDEQRDLALIKIPGEQVEDLKPIQFQPTALSRGAKVAAFGYPLSDLVGTGIKLTTGIVSALPDAQTEGMLVLDCRVNPGNSGGPLCNARGQAVGIVTAKSFTGDSVDSYGMAVPAADVIPFLTRVLPEFQLTLPTESAALEWDQVDQMVSPSVVMILKLR